MGQFNLSALLDDFSSEVAGALGLHYPAEKRKDLMRGVEAASRQLELDPVTLVKAVLDGDQTARDEALAALAQALTIGESYFFRETKTLAVLGKHILPALLKRRHGQNKRRLFLWSAGCATGEEPYTLAILLDRLFNKLDVGGWDDWKVRILATDINREFLQRSREGVYREWSFRTAPEWLKDRYFTPTEDQRWRIHPEIRERVLFVEHNLLDDAPRGPVRPGAVDVALCRNVLIYFTPEVMQRALQRIESALAPNGVFLTSPSETAHVMETGLFHPLKMEDILVFRPLAASRSDAVRQGEAGEADGQSSTPAISEENAGREGSTGPTEASVDDHAVTVPEIEVEVLPEPEVDLHVLDHRENAAMAAAKPAPPEDPATVLRQAAQDVARGDLAAAETPLRALLENDMLTDAAEAATAHTLIAQCLASRGASEEALEWCRKGLEIYKMSPGLRYLQGVILQDMGRLEEAAKSLDEALYLEPNLLMAHFSRGVIARALGDDKLARRHLTTCLKQLEALAPDQIAPLSEGLSAGRMRELVENLLMSE